MVIGPHGSLRAHLDVQAMLTNLRETRGRPAFQSVGKRSLSTDGCFSRRGGSDDQPFHDVTSFPKSLRSPSKSLTAAVMTPRGASRSSSTHQDTSHTFPFRSSSNQAPVPAREYVFTPSHRSPSQLSAASAVPLDAAILKRRDVNSSRRRSSAQQVDQEASVQRVVKLRYQEVTAAGQRGFPKLLRRAAASRNNSVVEVAPRTHKISPDLVWLHVQPGAYSVSSVPSTALAIIASFLPRDSLSNFALSSKMCSAAVVNLAADGDSASVSLQSRIPSGYFQALGLVDEQYDRDLQGTTITMMTIVLLLSGEMYEDIVRIASTPSAVVALWRQRFPTGDVKLDLLLADDHLQHHKAALRNLLSSRCRGKAPGDISQTAELEDANAALIVARAMSAVEWNTESF